MRTTNDGALLRQLDTLFNIGAIRELTDGQLLERFSTGPREAAELAFAALVERHAEMVLRVCRAQLADRHHTDDAFQATFLVLVKKSRTLWVRDSLGPWLHQDQGRITIDRFLDAVSQHATAIETEATYRATYNNTLVALELAKGTLLDHYGIDVIDLRKPGAGPVAAQGGAMTVLAQGPVGPSQSPVLPSPATSPSPVALPPSLVASKPPSISGNLPPAPPTPASSSTASPAATTYSFQFSVNLGSKPIEVRGSFTISPARAAESSKGD